MSSTVCLHRPALSRASSSPSRNGARSSSGRMRLSGLPSRPVMLQQAISGSRLARRHASQWMLSALAGGGDGGAGGSGSGGSGGGGGGGDDSSNGGDGKSWFVWKGWQERVAADPQFVYKVIIEQVIGVTANVLGDMASRPNWGLNELDFVFATLVVGSIINFAAVYLLAPVASSGGAAAQLSFVQKVFGQHYLVKWGAPVGHLFEPGYGLGSRLVNFGYKGAVFAFIGMCAGLVGTATSNGLLELRKKLDPEYKMQNEPPNILANAGTWALHMGLSANTRYQVLNGLDMVLQPLMPSTIFRLYASLIRGANNLAGGMSFVLLAKALGVQKAADAEGEQPAAPAGKKKA